MHSPNIKENRASKQTEKLHCNASKPEEIEIPNTN